MLEAAGTNNLRTIFINKLKRFIEVERTWFVEWRENWVGIGKEDIKSWGRKGDLN